MEFKFNKDKVKLDLKTGIVYWRPYGPGYKETEDPAKIYDYACYIAFYPNWLEKKHRHWGIEDMKYDGATHRAFGFWFFNISWCIY